MTVYATATLTHTYKGHKSDVDLPDLKRCARKRKRSHPAHPNVKRELPTYPCAELNQAKAFLSFGDL